MNTARFALVSASLFGASAVVLGAFGAHALRSILDGPDLLIWHTAVEYQFWHASALLAVGLLARGRATSTLRWAALALGVGIVLFCGSLYLLALGVPRAVGAITPIGGALFIVGWLALALHAWRDAAAP